MIACGSGLVKGQTVKFGETLTFSDFHASSEGHQQVLNISRDTQVGKGRTPHIEKHAHPHLRMHINTHTHSTHTTHIHT